MEKNQKSIISYTLVKDFPLQKKGDKIVKTGVNNWMFEKSKMPVTPEILKTDYFSPNYSSFALFEQVMYNGYLSTIVDFVGDKYRIKTLKNNKPIEVLVKESEIKYPETYWFFNSKLQGSVDKITSNAKAAEALARKRNGNYFETKEEVNAVIAKIKAIL